MQKPMYLALVLATAMFVLWFWASSGPSPIQHAAATSVGLSIGDMHRLIDMKALPIQEDADPI